MVRNRKGQAKLCGVSSEDGSCELDFAAELRD